MRLETRNTYAAEPDEVIAMLTDHAYRSSLKSRTRCLAHNVTITENTGSTEVLIEQTLKTTGIPSVAKRIVGETIDLVQKEVWTGRTATFELTSPGKPGHVRGTLTVASDGEGGTVEMIEAESKARIPVVGGKLENFMADLVRQSLKREQTRGEAWLAGER